MLYLAGTLFNRVSETGITLISESHPVAHVAQSASHARVKAPAPQVVWLSGLSKAFKAYGQGFTASESRESLTPSEHVTLSQPQAGLFQYVYIFRMPCSLLLCFFAYMRCAVNSLSPKWPFVDASLDATVMKFAALPGVNT